MNLNVMCRHSDKPGEKVRATSIDMSLGGIAMRSRGPLAKGKEVLMAIRYSLFAEPIEARGQVVWQGPLEESGCCRIGIRFTEIPWTRLRAYLA
jgi:c-di-GMP-binding flagellar brake protein YcgR